MAGFDFARGSGEKDVSVMAVLATVGALALVGLGTVFMGLYWLATHIRISWN